MSWLKKLTDILIGSAAQRQPQAPPQVGRPAGRESQPQSTTPAKQAGSVLANPRDYPQSLIVGVAEPRFNLGLEHSQVIAIHPGTSTRAELGNTLCIGSPGSGKGLLIEANLHVWQHSAIVVDLKGDTYTRTANIRRRYGEVYVLDPVHGTGHRINPLRILPQEQWRALAREIVSVSTNDPFWQGVAISFWLACWHAAEHAGMPHIPYALAIMSLSIDGAFNYLRAAHSDDPETMRHVAAFYGAAPSGEFARRLEASGPDRLLASKWGSVTESAQVLYDPNLRAIFSGHDVDVEGLFYNDGIGTVYVQASETNPAVFEIFVRTIISSIGNGLIREGDRSGVRRRPVLMLLDEIGAAPINDLARWKNTMRSRDIVLVVFAQDLSQLPSPKGKYSYNEENSYHHTIFFKPTNLTGELSKIIQEQAGMYTDYTTTESGGTSVGHGGHVSHSNGWSRSKKDHQAVRQEDMELWSDRHAYVVSSQAMTEKFTVRAASVDLLGWERPAPADLLPSLPPQPPMLRQDILKEIAPDHHLTKREQLEAALEIGLDIADTFERNASAQAWQFAGLPDLRDEEDNDPDL